VRPRPFPRRGAVFSYRGAWRRAGFGRTWASAWSCDPMGVVDLVRRALRGGLPCHALRGAGTGGRVAPPSLRQARCAAAVVRRALRGGLSRCALRGEAGGRGAPPPPTSLRVAWWDVRARRAAVIAGVRVAPPLLVRRASVADCRAVRCMARQAGALRHAVEALPPTVDSLERDMGRLCTLPHEERWERWSLGRSVQWGCVPIPGPSWL